MLNGLDLFSGIGGISRALNEWVKPVAYCEIDSYCQGVLLSNMGNRLLHKAPIWDDIRSLRSSDFDKLNIDIMYGGFPCQDISIAGNGKGLEGERSGLFFEVIRLAKEIEPKFIFLENVPAITSRGGLRIIKEIASMGYDCRWCIISAASVGALHKRERWFLLAYSNSEPSWKAYTKTKSDENFKASWIRYSRQIGRNVSSNHWKENKPPFHGMDDGLSNELDRAKALGNAVVPQQAKEAFKILMGLN